jgi:sugar phosphate isomerase/epimerase
MNELGIERLSVFGMPPVEFIHLAADLGCTAISLGPAAFRHNDPHGYPDWSFRADPALRRATVAALAARGVRIALFEDFSIRPDADIGAIAPDLDILCELGGERICVVSMERDAGRLVDQFGRAAQLCGERGLELTTEVGAMIRLETALDAIAQVGRPNLRLLLDTMHFFRLGWTLDDLAAIDPALVGYVQLCDAPWVSPFASYREEALCERRVPGEGELPLAAFLARIPAGVTVSLEVPQASLAQAGTSPRARLEPCVRAARALLAQVAAARA